jgi:TetR/AcrR family transcriptional regulator, tetracycline repressor protein
MKVQRQDVLDAALDLLDREGMDGLTMRRLAQALGIQAPSLYWHFPNKQALFDAMADAILRTITLPPDNGTRWDVWLRAAACEFRRALKARRDGARLYAGTFPVMDNVLRISDRVIEVLRAAGADETTAVRSVFTLQYFVLGFTIEEQATIPSNDDGVDLRERSRQVTSAMTARYPHGAAAVAVLVNDDDDARFHFGLDLLIAGLATKIGER